MTNPVCNTNEITINRTIDGQQILAHAVYNPDVDGWNCTVRRAGSLKNEHRDPDQTGNDVWVTLVDMIELQIIAE